jgi:DNA-binding response OmpR family regulator
MNTLVAQTNAETILVVSDDALAASAIRQCLERDGYGVVVAPDAAGALAHGRQQPVLILLDLAPTPLRTAAAGGIEDRAVVQPSVDGWEVFRRIRLCTDAPIIALGGHLGAVDGRGKPEGITALELGADDYVTRPFNPFEVAARVRAVLRRRRKVGPGPLPSFNGAPLRA